MTDYETVRDALQTAGVPFEELRNRHPREGFQYLRVGGTTLGFYGDGRFARLADEPCRTCDAVRDLVAPDC